MKVGGCGMKEVRGEPIHTIFYAYIPRAKCDSAYAGVPDQG